MSYQQGSVVLASDIFKDGLRPYIIVSNAQRPFHGENYTVAVMTTTERSEAIEVLPGEHIADGRLNKPSYINPWALTILSHEDISRRVAQVDAKIIQQICESAKVHLRYIPEE